MVADDLPCSNCPLLDLGVQYPVNDERDPWRRMPAVFGAARRVFGGAMFKHDSRPRARAEHLLGHYCRVQREKYGSCTRRRSTLCQGIVKLAFDHAASAPADQRYAYAQAALKRAATSDDTDALLKPTVIRKPSGPLRMPPITMREMPVA